MWFFPVSCSDTPKNSNNQPIRSDTAFLVLHCMSDAFHISHDGQLAP